MKPGTLAAVAIGLVLLFARYSCEKKCRDRGGIMVQTMTGLNCIKTMEIKP